MTRRPILLAAALGLGLLCQSNAGAQAPAAPAGDATKGQAVFDANCSTCHSTTQTSADSSSLSLFGVVGRKSGSNADFSYSPAMQAAGITWTPDKLDAYLTNPSAGRAGQHHVLSGTSRRRPKGRRDRLSRHA